MLLILGNAFACSTLCGQIREKEDEEGEEEDFHLAQLATAQLERVGFFWLGYCFRDGVGCEANVNFAKENYLIAAELGDVAAAAAYGQMMDESDPLRWLWLGRAAMCGEPFWFVRSFSKLLTATSVFLVGRALDGNISLEKKKIFGTSHNFDSLLGPANQAVSFYDSQIQSARLAVDTWSLVSTRLHLIKDMRILIGKMIWDARFEAKYKI